MSLVSVYLPTKDRVDLLKKAVRSVLLQSHRDFELIVVDDGSADATGSYLNGLQACDPRVKVISHPTPLGAPRSRNDAINLSRGEWITGLDDDDEFMPKRLEAFLNYVRVLSNAEIEFSCLFAQDETHRDGAVSVSRKKGSIELGDLFLRNEIGNQIFVRTNVLRASGMFDESMPAWQDLDLVMRVVAQNGTARLLDIPLYRFSNDSRTDRISRGGKQKLLRAYETLVGKWASVDAARRQELFMQIFSNYYGERMSMRDVRRYLRMGITRRSVFNVARQCLR